MKITPKKLVMLSILAVFPTVEGSENPTGEITANAEVVRAGAYPKLNWSINYPPPAEAEPIEDFIDVTPSGEIVSKTDVTMQIRCLAADVQEKSYYYKNGYRYTKYRYIDVAGQVRVDNEDWQWLFYNIQPYVDPSKILMQREVDEGETVLFRSQAAFSGSITYYSGESSENVLVLKNGDYPPSYTTWSTQSTLDTHIGPYLDENGAVDIGPLDLIVVFELTHDMSPSGNGGGDMQDMIFLLTFTED